MTDQSIEGLKVVSSQEMARIESIAYSEGASEETFMENAGEVVAEAALAYIQINELPKIVTLLVGKGNNGGDAYAAGTILMQHGCEVTALPIYPLESCGPLCRQMYEKFRSCGGNILEGQSLSFEPDGIILDGLVGTGFKGKAEDALARAIEGANQSGLPILAIDIPSGLNGTTGEVGTVAIHATITIALGLPKIGFFLKDGWDHVGVLHTENFGLEQKYIDLAKPLAFLLNEERPFELFPPLKRTRHKYEAGYVLAVAGSKGMPGAALLSSYAVLRSGAGMVRLFHPSGMEEELSGAPYELIRQGWEGKDIKCIQQEAKRAKSLLIGPGIGRENSAKQMLQNVLENIALPMVIDADALFFLAENPSWKIPSGSVLTPHVGEMSHLLKGEKPGMELCQKYAEEKNVTVVLKGAPTFIFHPHTTPIIIHHGDPGMATAGSGDVLTGIIASMMAQGCDARKAASLAVYLHGLSGEIAASSLSSYCMTASDLIEFLPDAFLQTLD